MDKKALKSIIVLKGIKMYELAHSLGISRTALHRKINGTSEFTRKEIVLMIEILDIDDPISIFFNKKVS